MKSLTVNGGSRVFDDDSKEVNTIHAYIRGDEAREKLTVKITDKKDYQIC